MWLSNVLPRNGADGLRPAWIDPDTYHFPGAGKMCVSAMKQKTLTIVPISERLFFHEFESEAADDFRVTGGAATFPIGTTAVSRFHIFREC
ncbi:hypothetical protein [Rhizorhabdus sp. FW153]|uniref:hypothetical protein n=1 Tax=Rhizorhabdus sp. FW153 TaxID=3400216 RepID=UPI003CF37C4B